MYNTCFPYSQILGLSDSYATNRTIPIEGDEYTVRDLSPGATYQVQAFTVFDNRESLAYTSHNFTTSKEFFFCSSPLFLSVLFGFTLGLVCMYVNSICRRIQLVPVVSMTDLIHICSPYVALCLHSKQCYTETQRQ